MLICLQEKDKDIERGGLLRKNRLSKIVQLQIIPLQLCQIVDNFLSVRNHGFAENRNDLLNSSAAIHMDSAIRS